MVLLLQFSFPSEITISLRNIITIASIVTISLHNIIMIASIVTISRPNIIISAFYKEISLRNVRIFDKSVQCSEAFLRITEYGKALILLNLGEILY